jgi:hypothetical protein
MDLVMLGRSASTKTGGRYADTCSIIWSNAALTRTNRTCSSSMAVRRRLQLARYRSRCLDEQCGQVTCENACFAEAVQIFNNCLASGENLVVCDALADDNYEQCLTSCQ